MKSLKTVCVIVSFGVICLCRPLPASAYTKSGTVYTTDGSYTDVAAAVLNASVGDTVNVPAGSFSWNTPLAIRKGINLIGAGAGATTITAVTGAEAWPYMLIYYSPADYTLNAPLRISGFTFALRGITGGIRLYMAPTNTVLQTKIRIDHNVFDSAGGTIPQALWVSGYRGVADNNTFTGTAYPIRFAEGPSNALWWDNWEGLVFGKLDNTFWFEDNIINIYDIITDCQYSNRYAFRYNTITASASSVLLMEQHGNISSGGQYSGCFGSEIYGNVFNTSASSNLIAMRAGRHAIFYNSVVGQMHYIKIYEEACDGENPTTNTQPDHVSGSYEWVNLKTLPTRSLWHFKLDVDFCGIWKGYSDPKWFSPDHLTYYGTTYRMAENQDFWNYSPTYNGTAPGVGCGAALPPVCTTGDGYWLTTQSCSDLTGLVGASHTQNITGTFYTCKAGNVWDFKFTPLTYPHPLRAPASPTKIVITK